MSPTETCQKAVEHSSTYQFRLFTGTVQPPVANERYENQLVYEDIKVQSNEVITRIQPATTVSRSTDGEGCEIIIRKWLATFQMAVKSRALNELKKLFLEESFWRDQIGLTWDMRQYHSRDTLLPPLISAAADMRIANFEIARNRTAPRMVDFLGEQYLEGFFDFDLPHGVGQAMVRLKVESTASAGALCYTLCTDLKSVNGIEEQHARKVTPEAMEPVFPIHGYEPDFDGQTWNEWLQARKYLKEADPDVLILGGGHSGVMVAARLHAMGQSYLIIDKTERPGDSWRNRYESLALHTVGATNQLPYIRTPEIFPDYIPKDRWADWIESYVKAMGLNYWSSTELLRSRFDETTGRWNCEVRCVNGTILTLRPIHVVLAFGAVGSQPLIPNLPGLDNFKGTVIHSKYFKTGRDFTGKQVLVVGTSTSAHDIAFDLYNKGAQVTMSQRGPAIITRLVEGVEHNGNYVRGEMSVDEADQRRGANGIRPLRDRYLQLVTEKNRPHNAALNEKLEKAGLKLWEGPDNTGWLGRLAREFKGFYINMGCADVIATGGIKIVQAADIECFVTNGARMKDGSLREIDAIVLATGFLNQNSELIGVFGKEIVERIGPCAGFDNSGEQHGNAKPLCHQQIWQVYGGINDVRRLSKILGLQIAAQLAGKVPPLERQADGLLKACPIPR